MKSIFIITLLSLFTFTTTACNKIKPSKDVSTEERSIGTYEKLSVYDAFDVSITYGSATSKITVEANDNLMKYIITSLDGDYLVIKLDSKISVKSSATLKVNITVPKLTKIQISGASSVTFVNELNTSSLVAELSGASSLKGIVNLSTLNLDLSGASNANLIGTVDTGTMDISGASTVTSYDCAVNVLGIDLSGASSGALTVNGVLNVTASGASSFHYKGNPTISTQDITGASSLVAE